MLLPQQDFGSVVTGSSPSAVVMVENPGGSPTGSLKVAITGPDAADFALQPGGCAGATLAPGGTCSVVVRFSPTSRGEKHATLQLGAVGTDAATMSLTGTGLEPGALALTPAAPTFGTVAVGQTGTTLLTLTNSGGTPTGPIGFALGGTGAGELKVTGDGCTGLALGAGKSCSVTVVFSPAAAGPKLASLTASASPGGAAAVSLGATATGDLQLGVGGSGKGTVRSSVDGIDCGSACLVTHTFATGSVTLLAAPAPGSVFQGWTGCDATPSSTACVVALDAPVRKVRAAFGGVPDAGVPDAPPPDAPQPDAPQADLRPWSGPTADLRFIDAQVLGGFNWGQLCVFGDTSDPRPYFVLTDKSREPGEVATRKAEYAAVPAGVPLYASVTTVFSSATVPAACDRAAAGALRSGNALVAGKPYTAVATHVAPAEMCSSSFGLGCLFAPTRTPDDATDVCADSAVHVLRDDVYTGAYRVVNVTRNAAAIATSLAATDLTKVLHYEISFAETTGYPLAPRPRVVICPQYVQECYASIGGSDGNADQLSCAAQVGKWIVGYADVPRITQAGKKTTIYVMGDARAPMLDASGLDFAGYPYDVTFAVASDITD